MAVAPLFVATMDELRQAVRLSTEALNNEAVQILDRAVLEVRVGCYDRLGATLVASLKAVTPSDAPTTSDELSRARAEQVEVSWVKLVLLRELRALFMDASGQTGRVWNEEATFRDSSSRDIRELMDSLRSVVDEGIEALKSGGADNTSVRAEALSPAVTPPRPFDSVFKKNGAYYRQTP